MADDTDKAAFVARLHKKTKLRDFTIICGKVTWEVHRLVLAAHSDVMEVSCAGVFKETSDRSLDLSDHDVDVVDGLVEFMYHFNYDLSMEKHHSASGMLAYHVQICVVADKYDLQSLKKLAVKNFHDALDSCSSAEEFANAARFAYDASNATKEIREGLVRKAAEDLAIGVNPEKWTEFEDVMMEYPELAVTVAKAVRGTTAPPQATQGSSAAMGLLKCPNDACSTRYLPTQIPQDGRIYVCYQCAHSYTSVMWHRAV